MGDLFLTGPPRRWTTAAPRLDQSSGPVLDLPLDAVVPGHFELGTKSTFSVSAIISMICFQVQTLSRKGATLEEVRRDVHMEKYSDFRQYPKLRGDFCR